jgi:hypothetical protein
MIIVLGEGNRREGENDKRSGDRLHGDAANISVAMQRG